MTDPIIELAKGIVLVDLTDDMPRHKTKRYRKRDKIERIYVHHSGRLGKPGKEGAINSARYVVRHREFAGPAYHLWVPWHDVVIVRDTLQEKVCYRMNADETRCWHTGGKANTHGIGICLQGNTTTNGMSDSQKEVMEALLPWCFEHYGLWRGGVTGDWVSWHSEAGQYGGKSKKACPGVEATEWLEAYRGEG